MNGSTHRPVSMRSIISLHDIQQSILHTYATPINYSWALLSIPLGAMIPLIAWTWLFKAPVLILSTVTAACVVPAANVLIYMYYMLTSASPSYYSQRDVIKSIYYLVLHSDTLIKREHICTSMLVASTICFIMTYLYIEHKNNQILLRGNAVIQEMIDHNVRLFTEANARADKLARPRSRSRTRLRLR